MLEQAILPNLVRNRCACWAGLDDEAQCAGTPAWSSYPPVITQGKRVYPIVQRFNDSGKCWVLQGQTCEHFEKNVLPLSAKATKVYETTRKPPPKQERIRGNSLTVFVRAECANWDNATAGCLGMAADNKESFHTGNCRIMEGRSCPYFKEVVLPIAAHRGVHKKIFGLYRKQDHTVAEKRIRLCPDCGEAELTRPRQRCCDKCRRLRRLAAYRRARNGKKSDAQQLSKTAVA